MPRGLPAIERIFTVAFVCGCPANHARDRPQEKADVAAGASRRDVLVVEHDHLFEGDAVAAEQVQKAYVDGHQIETFRCPAGQVRVLCQGSAWAHPRGATRRRTRSRAAVARQSSTCGGHYPRVALRVSRKGILHGVETSPDHGPPRHQVLRTMIGSVCNTSRRSPHGLQLVT